MSYTKTTWSDGDIITANKMNNIETGVESLNTDVGQLQTDLDSLAETVTDLPSGGDYQELVDDVSDLKADFSQIYNGKKLIFGGDISGTQYTIVDVELSAGTYHLDADNIASDDTDSNKCIVLFSNSATSTNILTLTLNRDVAISVDVILTAQADKIYFYASNSSNHAAGDAFTYSNVALTQALTDATLTVSGGYADAKATGGRH